MTMSKTKDGYVHKNFVQVLLVISEVGDIHTATE